MVALIYAPSGGGKTVNTTLVKGLKNLLLCSDNSSIVLRNFTRDNLTIEPIKKWLKTDNEGLEQDCLIKQFEKAVDGGFSTIIIDNLSDVFDMAILEYEDAQRYKDMRKAYLETYNEIKRLVRKATLAGCNVIFTAWHEFAEFTNSDGKKVTRIQPKLPSKILDNVLGLCNVVGYVRHGDKDGKTVWWYDLNGREEQMAKDQLFCRKYCMPEDLFEVK